MKILVTGSTGFLGKFLCKKLEENNDVFKTNSKTNDLTKENSLDVFNKIKFDQIFHLAAWTQAGDFCLYHSGEQWVINQKINTNILSWWHKNQPQAKMIALGTSCSYDPTLPHIEDNYLLGKPIDSLFTYAMTKRMLLTGLIALNKQYGLTYNYFIPSTLYGADYHLDGRQMHFIFDLIRKILKAKYFNDRVILWGDGNQRRELVYVEDFINIMLFLNKEVKNEIVNIGSGQDYSIKDFANIICNITGYNFNKIEFDISKYVGAKSKILIIDKLKSIVNYDMNLKSINLGVQETINWFEKNKCF